MSRALLVRHLEQTCDDRVSQFLANHGFQLDWCCPANGEPLPAQDGRHSLAVFYGGLESANDAERRPHIREEIAWIRRWVAAHRPYLGLCLGGQLLARALGANVSPHPAGVHEIGYVPITPTVPAAEFLDSPLHVYQWHNEGFQLPKGAELLAVGETFDNQAFRYGTRAYGLQFHPEATIDMMQSWLRDGSEALAATGAHPRERQISEAEKYDEAMANWCERFLQRWIETA